MKKSLPCTCDSEHRLRRVPVGQLQRFQGNLKTLHYDQYAKLKASMKSKGFFAPIFLWTGHDYILDGHQRLNVLEREQWDVDGGIPVVDIEAADEKDAAEKLLLLSSTYGKIDPQGVYEFTELHGVPLTEFNLPDLPDFDYQAYQAEYYDDIQGDGDNEEAEDEMYEEGIFALREEAIFSSSNHWQIPDLREDKLSTRIPGRVWPGFPEDLPYSDAVFIYSKTSGVRFRPEMAKGAFLAFYEEDEKFESIWHDAVKTIGKMITYEWGTIISPDFSLWRLAPLAVQFFNLYRSRWCARYWQELGLEIIPNLSWSDERSYEWCFKTLPEHIPVASAQCRTSQSQKGKDYFIRGLLSGLETVSVDHLVFYGGEQHRKWIEGELSNGIQCHWLSSWSDLRTRKLKEERSLAMRTWQDKQEGCGGGGGGGGGGGRRGGRRTVPEGRPLQETPRRGQIFPR